MRVRRGFALVLLGLVAGPLVRAQEVPTKPLGDVAREQRDARKLSRKDPQKVYTNEGGTSPRLDTETGNKATPPVTAGDSRVPETTAPGPQTAVNDNTAPKPIPAAAATPDNAPPKATETAKPADLTKDTDGRSVVTPVVIPVGTEIQVDISKPSYGRYPPEEGAVIAPVYVGSSMGIPARARVTLRSSRTPDSFRVSLTSVTINGASYQVHTNPALLSGSRKELTFTLSQPLTIP